MRHGEVVVEQDLRYHETIDVGFVGPKQCRRVIAYYGSDALKILGVVIELGLVAQTQAEVAKPVPDVQPKAGGNRDHLAEVVIGFLDDLGSGFSTFFGNLIQLVFEGLLAAQ